MRAMLRWGLTVAGVAAIAPWRFAHASNAAKPRTPPIFKREACLSVVDRSVEPVFHLDFAIPYEDAMLTADELDDSRRFQFFATCRDHSWGEALPNWVHLEDAERSFAAGIITALPEPTEVLESAPSWSTGHDGVSSCAVAINSDAERIPITCESTEGGLDWDTTGVPAGNYVLHGYTFEPELNLWVTRRGVVQVVDDADERYAVVSIMFPAREGTRAYAEDGYRVVGCMDGPSGTTVRLSWTTAGDLAPGETDEATWREFAVLDAADQAFDIAFDIPADAVQQAVVFRGVAEDPQGGRWIAYSRAPLLVYPGDGESDAPFKPAGPDFCGFYPDDEGDTTGGIDPGLDDGEDDGETGEGHANTDASSATRSSDGHADDIARGGHSGCDCRATPSRRSREALLALGLLALGATRRR